MIDLLNLRSVENNLKPVETRANRGSARPCARMASSIIGMPDPLPSAGEPTPSGNGTSDMSFTSVALRHRELPSNRFSRVFPPYRPPGFVTSIRSSKTSTAIDCPQNRSPYSRWITALAIASRRTSSGISSESTRETLGSSRFAANSWRLPRRHPRSFRPTFPRRSYGP